MGISLELPFYEFFKKYQVEMNYLINSQHDVLINILIQCDILDILNLKRVCISLFRYVLNKNIISKIVNIYISKVELKLNQYFDYILFINYSIKNKKSNINELIQIKNHIIGNNTFLSGGFLLGMFQSNKLLDKKEPDIYYNHPKESDIDIFVDKTYKLPENIKIKEDNFIVEFCKEIDTIVNENGIYKIVYKLYNYNLKIKFKNISNSLKIQYIICDNPINIIKKFDFTFLQFYYHNNKINIIQYNELPLVCNILRSNIVSLNMLTDEEKQKYIIELKYLHIIFQSGFINKKIIKQKTVDRITKYIKRGYTFLIS